MKSSRLFMLVAAAALSCALLAAPMIRKADAQTPSNPAPYNVDLGAVISNALRTAGTVTTSPEANTNWRGVVCVIDITASSGSPSASIKIQAYDAATASWTDYVQSGSVTGYPATPVGQRVGVMIYPGASAGVPAGYTTLAAHLPRTWRVSQTMEAGAGGSGKSPAMTGHVGCNYLL